MNVHAATRMTADEYFAVSTVGDRTQLVEGVMIVNEPIPLDHGMAQAQLITALTNWVEAVPDRGLAFPPADVVVDEHNVYGPDVLWVPEDNLPGRGERLKGLPDLAVEIRSPSTWRYDIGAKKDAYERAGLKELWLVDTKSETVLVFRRSSPDAPVFDVALELSGADELTSPLLPGFSLRAERLFRR
jgi:Uma2 family endonuclease